MPFSSRILKVLPPRHFIKPTDINYDGSTDPHVHLNDFEHRMICDGAVDEVKCRAFPITLTGLARPISSYSEIRELFLNEFPQVSTTRKFIERFNAECKTIDGLVDGVASLCLTNDLTSDDFIKQLTTKPVWSRKEMQVIAKEFIHCEEVNRVVAATKNPQRERSPRPESRNPRNHRDYDERIMEVTVITGSNAMEKSKLALKKDLKIPATVRTPPPQFPTITFEKEDFVHGLADSDSPMVISAKLGPGLVHRILVDTGADSNIMFKNALDSFGFKK
ncbi:hypothetical protein PIB30_084698 [Stylosanthes scabra]|uniref:Peptidase A2 domain-containing protein n=1 Tax=Stylosanthes scabra TaxID=79078 RepID=A0ABU6YQV6_9FABA|nr:hypothetical protein [Stylosanthes scabra]